MSTEYNILARVKIDGTEADAYFKKPRTLPVKVKATDVDKLSTTLGKIDNQLAKIKITNKDAFSNSQAVRDSYNETVRFRNALEKGTVTQGQYQVQFGKTNNEIARYNEQSRTTINNTDNFASSIGKAVGKIALWGVATGLLYGSLKRIQEGVQYIKDLNMEMTNIGLVSGQTTQQLSGMATEFNNMAKELGATTLDMAEGATTWIRQGKSAADTMELLRVSTMLSKLGDLEAAEATEKLTAVLNGYRLEVEDAIEVTDTLIVLDNMLATSTQAIVDGMSKASSMANAAGVSYKNLATFIGVTQAVTQQSGDTVGQAYKTLLARFQQVKAGAKIFEDGGEVEDINNVEKALRSQGIAIRDSVGSFRELDDVIPEVAAKYEELMAAGRDVEAKQIVGAIAGVRQINMLETLFQNWDIVKNAQTEVADSMGFTTQRYTIYLDSIEAKSNKLKAAMEEMWAKTISDDLIKGIIDTSTGVLELVDNLGGLVPVLTAIAAAIIAIKWSSISASLGGVFALISNLGPAFTALAGRIMFATGVTNTFAASQTAMAASTALATGGISILVAGLVLLLLNLDKIIPSMTTLNEKFQELKADTDENVDELSSLAEEYENLSNKAEKSSDDLARLLDIQSILNTKYGAAKDGINTYTDAIDGNSLAIQENIKWMKERAELEASNFIESNRQEYEKAKRFLSESSTTAYGTMTGTGFATGTAEERLAKINSQISKGGIYSGPRTEIARDKLQDEISAAQQLAIDYEHYTNVLDANTIALELNADATSNTTSKLEQMFHGLERLPNIHTADELTKLKEAADDASGAVVSTADSVKSLINSLEESNVVSMAQVEQLKNMFPETYMQALVFEEGQFKLNTEALKGLTIAKAEAAVVTAQTALDAINADIRSAQSSIDAAESIISANQAVISSQIGLSTAYIMAAQDAIASANAQVDAAKAVIEGRKTDMIVASNAISTAKAYVTQLKNTSYWTKDLAKATGGASSATNKLAEAQKKAYQDEIKGINNQKKALEAQKKALNDQKKAYKEIIDAKKESLKLAKDESDFNKTLAEKNKDLIDIENALFAIQFDNSQEAVANRLKLEEEKAKKMEEIAQLQADRTYDIQIEALDREYAAFENMINMQIDAIEVLIDGFNNMIDKINEMIDALAKLATAQAGGGYAKQTKTDTKKKYVSTASDKTKFDEIAQQYLNQYNNQGTSNSGTGKDAFDAIAQQYLNQYDGVASGGSFEVMGSPSGVDSKLLPVAPGELGIAINRSQQNSIAPLASFFNSILKNTGTPQFTPSASNNNGINMGDIVFQVSGSLDRSAIPDIKSAVFEVLNQTNIIRGKRANAFTNSI